MLNMVYLDNWIYFTVFTFTFFPFHYMLHCFGSLFFFYLEKGLKHGTGLVFNVCQHYGI